MSSRAERQSYVAIVSVYLLTSLFLEHQEANQPEKDLCNLIINHVKGEAAEVLAFEVRLKEVPKLNSLAVNNTEMLGRDYSIAALICMWMAWAEDRIAATRNPGKKAFFEELLSLLDSLYMLIDPDYAHKEAATEAMAAMRKLEEAVA